MLNHRVSSTSSQSRQGYKLLTPHCRCALNTRTKNPYIKSRIHSSKKVDVVSLGNLCVDVVLPVKELPPADVEYRRKLLDTLTKTSTDTSKWEVGGNCNFMIAASRIGLAVTAVGHFGKDVHGKFMEDILKEELVEDLRGIATSELASAASINSTLLCFVLLGPDSKHAFCSRYDFGPWPLLRNISSLPEYAQQCLRVSRAVFTNGFIFDELPLAVVQDACIDALNNECEIFFDPGPRCHTMMEGERRIALEMLLDLSSVVLMTEEEAKVITGSSDAETAARWVLGRSNARAAWCVVKMGHHGALLARRVAKDASRRSTTHRAGRFSSPGEYDIEIMSAPGYKVDVLDTVGCGDSFASAVVSGFINNYDIKSTLAMANAVGAATAMGRGAGRHVARAEKIKEILRRSLEERTGEEAKAIATALGNLERSLAARAQKQLDVAEKKVF